ncbi:MAG: gamma-glutamyl-gamma-aminobutyrate hydrolase family protein [Candidatus Pacebacteria bacterium]|nr:gamma-glutamyl-gamma-aminobutyrate hydrolase family protein [Candidatus Paceibacterota bacterium]
MEELHIQRKNNNLETEKKVTLNKDWNDKNFLVNIEGKKLTIRECYDKAIKRSNEIFESTRKVALEEIPNGKYILYINSTIEGLVRSGDIEHIDEKRLEYMYLAETGSTKIDPDNFPKNNILRCLGLKEEDNRLVAINAFKDEIPKDLSNCVGIVFSGSETDITDETHLERIEMTNKARILVKKSDELLIPKLGICFGGQLLASEAGAKIQWILNEKGEKIRKTGLNIISETKVDRKTILPFEFNKTSYYVAQNHGQEIIEGTIPYGGEIIAKSIDGKPELIYFVESNTICTQFHPEVSTIRLDIAEDIINHKEDRIKLFTENPDEMKEVLFPNYLKMAGSYIRNKSK